MPYTYKQFRLNALIYFCWFIYFVDLFSNTHSLIIGQEPKTLESSTYQILSFVVHAWKMFRSLAHWWRKLPLRMLMPTSAMPNWFHPNSEMLVWRGFRSQTHLQNVKFTAADDVGAVFCYADLSCANWCRAFLRGCNLGAHLTY